MAMRTPPASGAFARRVRCNRALKHLFFTSGVHYWEVDVARTDARASALVVGAVPSERFDGETLNGPLAAWTGGAVGYAAYGAVVHNGAEIAARVEPFGEGDVVGVLLDLNARAITFYRNGRDVAYVVADQPEDGADDDDDNDATSDKRVLLAPIRFTSRAMFAAVTFAPETDRFDVYSLPPPT